MQMRRQQNARQAKYTLGSCRQKEEGKAKEIMKRTVLMKAKEAGIEPMGGWWKVVAQSRSEWRQIIMITLCDI